MEDYDRISPEIIFSEIFTTRKLTSGHTAIDYSIWKHKILFIFANKGIDYVLRTTKPPGDETATNKWIRHDAIAQTLIYRALEDNFVLPYRELDTAKSKLDYLESLYNYGPPMIQRRINVFRSYINLRMDETTSISKHVLEMRAAVHELEMAGVKVPEEMQAVVLMNSLPESWNDVAYLLNLQLKENELGFANVCERLRIAAEMRPRRGGGGGNNPGNKAYCCLCRQSGHNLSNCPEEEKTRENCDPHDSPFMEELNIYEMFYQRQKTSQKLDYTGTDFLIWKSMLFRHLNALDLDHVLEQPKPPEPTDSTQEQDVISYKKWLADDDTCRHLILGVLEDDLFLAFKNQPTAKALMDELNAWFNFPSLGRRMALFRQYVAWHMSDNTGINDHIYHMNRMVGELKRAGIDVPDEIQAVVLIASLPRSWEDIRLPMTLRIDEETKKGGKLLDIVTKRVRDAGNIRALTESRNSNVNYHGNSKKKKGYEARY